jgi:hypothetical protein
MYDTGVAIKDFNEFAITGYSYEDSGFFGAENSQRGFARKKEEPLTKRRHATA